MLTVGFLTLEALVDADLTTITSPALNWRAHYLITPAGEIQHKPVEVAQ